MIVCNDIHECELFYNALDILNKTFLINFPPIYKTSEDNAYEDQNINIITNCSGCRGQDYLEVLVVLNPIVHHKRQYVIESMSRCIGNLLLIVPYPYKQHEAAQSKKFNCPRYYNRV